MAFFADCSLSFLTSSKKHVHFNAKKGNKPLPDTIGWHQLTTCSKIVMGMLKPNTLKPSFPLACVIWTLPYTSDPLPDIKRF